MLDWILSSKLDGIRMIFPLRVLHARMRPNYFAEDERRLVVDNRGGVPVAWSADVVQLGLLAVAQLVRLVLHVDFPHFHLVSLFLPASGQAMVATTDKSLEYLLERIVHGNAAMAC